MRSIKSALLIGLLTISFGVFAGPVGTAFTYQGELQQLGDPATGSYDFQFNLYDVEVDGAALTSPVQLEDVNVQDGVFTVELDFGMEAFDGSQLWLGIGVRDGLSVGDFSTLSPRQAVNATPYAIQASTVPDGSITADQINPTSVQQRVNSYCGAGSSIRIINTNGTVTCEPDTDSVLSEAQVDSYVDNNNYSTGPHTVDTTLTEGQVDAFVANNGYLTTEVDGSITNEIELPIQAGNDGKFLTTNGATPSWAIVGPDTTCSLSDCIYPGRATLSCGASSVSVNCVVPTAPWTARSAAGAEDSTWKSVTYGGGLFVAVASLGTTKFMTSPDGITWTPRYPLEANSWSSVTYGGGLFVAVAYDGIEPIMTSPDGVNWHPDLAPETNAWVSVTYGDGLFVAVAQNGTNQVMTSPDGDNWTPRSAAEANIWESVTYGGGMFVAVSSNGENRVMTSPDGVNWTARSATGANLWKSVSYGDGLFVAVASDGANQVMTSPDGITWTARSASNFTNWWSVTYGGGLFVAVSRLGTSRVMTSPDGINWTAQAEAEANQWISVTYGGGQFVAVAQTGTNRVMTSP